MTHLKQNILILLIVTSSILIFGQENQIDKNLIYYELGGTGFGPFSLNYERNFSLSEKVVFAPGAGISFTKYIQVGGTYNIEDYQLFIPIQVNFLFGKTNHQFETGFGMPIAVKDGEFGFAGNIYVLRLGYRYLNKQSGFIFRASINPTMIVFNPSLMGGLSIGYRF